MPTDKNFATVELLEPRTKLYFSPPAYTINMYESATRLVDMLSPRCSFVSAFTKESVSKNLTLLRLECFW